jgi:hypothetical protein
MEHLNYCRQLLMQFKAMAEVPSLEPERLATVQHVMDLCRASKKFILPAGGKLFDDSQLRALDESEPLRLPFSFLALEFPDTWPNRDGVLVAVKRVLFVREDADGVYVRPCAFLEHNGFWIAHRDFRFDRTGYLDRSDPDRVVVNAELAPSDNSASVFRDGVTVLSFLNALACSNVRIEQSLPRKAGKKVKAALPFDAYHVLTIDVPGRPGERNGIGGAHRSPREHLRRGHIRRLADGRRIWVNATVVAAGRGAGVVTKAYALRAAA